MIDIKVFEDGELKKVYEDVTIFYGATGVGVLNDRLHVNIGFACNTIFEPKKCWTGKFICVANRSCNMRYTPGCVYEATESYIADDTPIYYNRGEDWQFASSDFETLRKEFAKRNVDIIEYKNEKMVKEK